MFFPNDFHFRHAEAPHLWRLELSDKLVKAARSAYTHLFIDLGKLNVVSCPPSRHRLASSHLFTPTTSTNLILVTGMRGLPPLLLGDHLLPNKLYCARWQKNNWNFSITIKDQTTLSQLQSLKGTDVELGSYLPNAITTAHRKNSFLLIVIKTQAQSAGHRVKHCYVTACLLLLLPHTQQHCCRYTERTKCSITQKSENKFLFLKWWLS